MTDTQSEPAQAAADAEARVWALLVAKARQAVTEDPELGAKVVELGASPGWDDVIISEMGLPGLAAAPAIQPPAEGHAAEQTDAAGMPPSLEELLADSAVAQAFESAVRAEVKRLREADPSLQDIPDDQLAALLEDAVDADYRYYVEHSSDT
jgi:hypothetical protein